MRSRFLLTMLLLLAAAFQPLAAQELSPEALSAIQSASHARARLTGEGWHRLAGSATSPAASPDGAQLYLAAGRGGEPTTPIALSRVAQVQVARGSHAGSGAKIGGGIGLGLSLLAIAITAGDDWAAPTAGQAIAGTILNTAFGAGVGALIGLASPRWHTVYGVDPP
jgi:hypothetical protein